jgi:pimeloyl-ACP methyl ester carboxylesterase
LGSTTVQRKIDAGVSLPGEKALRMAVEIRYPDPAIAKPVALVCLPGGAMNMRFFDLYATDGSQDAMSFSFARQMSARGFIVVMFDYLGLGGSDKPADGYALTPEVLTRAGAQALGEVLRELRKQVPELKSIGVGHSMGAMMTVLQQAHYHPHAGLALLGFSTRGLPEYLIPEARALAAQGQDAVRAKVVELARKTFKVPYPVIESSSDSGALYAGNKADPRAAAVIKPASEPLLPVPAFMSMLPGNVAPEAAQVDVPVFLAVGELDIAGPSQDIPAAFPASPDVSLHIWPATGHSHFLFPSRIEQFETLAAWVDKVTAACPRAGGDGIRQ